MPFVINAFMALWKVLATHCHYVIKCYVLGQHPWTNIISLLVIIQCQWICICMYYFILFVSGLYLLWVPDVLVYFVLFIFILFVCFLMILTLSVLNWTIKWGKSYFFMLNWTIKLGDSYVCLPHVNPEPYCPATNLCWSGPWVYLLGLELLLMVICAGVPLLAMQSSSYHIKYAWS